MSDPDPSLLHRYPWLRYVLPLAVYMLVGTLEPTPADDGNTGWLALSYSAYPIVYSVKIVLTLLAIGLTRAVWRDHPFRINPWAIGVGVVGVVLWVGVCGLDIEHSVLGPMGLNKIIDLGTRSAFNPLEALADNPAGAWGFLAIRFLGLVLIVPLVEELFLRGFLMRYVIDPDWHKIPFGTLTPLAVVVGTVFPMLMHPAELVAAALWFSMITLLMAKTRNLFDCIVAHAVTNLLLGVYVVSFDQWQLV